MDPNAVQKVSPRFQYPPSIRRARWRSSLSDSLLVRSFSDGGSGLDSESAPSRTLLVVRSFVSLNVRERGEGKEKASCLLLSSSPLVPAERLGILCFTLIFVCSWACRSMDQNRGEKEMSFCGISHQRSDFQRFFRGHCIRQPSLRLATWNVGLGSCPRDAQLIHTSNTLHHLASNNTKGNRSREI